LGSAQHKALDRASQISSFFVRGLISVNFPQSTKAAVFPSRAIDSPPLSPQRKTEQRAGSMDGPHTQRQQVLSHHLRYSKTGCLIAAVLIAMGSGLDHFAYPERFKEFLELRWIAIFALLGVWVLLGTDFGARHARSISMAWLMIPQGMIAWMIHDTQGAESSYFAGLLLALYAVGTVLPLTVFESAFFGGVTLLLYATACATVEGGLELASTSGASFFTHGLFILMSAITAIVCAWLSEKSRNRLQSMKDQLSEKNGELKEINHTLSQIKGQLLERERMAAIGSLSAGLLQELNNPVNQSMLALNMGLGMSAVRGDKMLAETLQDAREGMERVRGIVSDLRSFSIPEATEDSLQPFLLEKAVRSAIRLSSFDLKGIPVSVDMPTDTQVTGDEPALIGVLINLLSNAAQAVKTVNRPYPGVQLRGELRGDRMQISVRDNGQGIPKDVITRVFDPFFTTRGIGSGLGLGLSISQAIVQRHGSKLTVQSEPGNWTEFSFELATR
jgi:two-component system, sensor histidine kinase PhcS